jgi:hypothetical protein
VFTDTGIYTRDDASDAGACELIRQGDVIYLAGGRPSSVRRWWWCRRSTRYQEPSATDALFGVEDQDFGNVRWPASGDAGAVGRLRVGGPNDPLRPRDIARSGTFVTDDSDR